MKSSWEKLKRLALSQHQNHSKDDKTRLVSHHRPCPNLLDDFTQASKDMYDMKKCKDAILYAAAAASNSAFEFSESLRKMGTCLLEQSALTDDEQSGNALRMLSKVQFELQELVDSYRSHIIQITKPPESVLNQLQTVEEMKQQCDEKRNVYQCLLAAQRNEADSPQQLQAASKEYEREATCFVFRSKSLKKEQTRSLLTQAVRHHAAQISLFGKGLKSLEAIDLEVRLVAKHLQNDPNSHGLADRYKEKCASLSSARNNLRYTLPLGLEKHEINLISDKTKESNIGRASNKIYPPLPSQKLGKLHDLPSPPSASNLQLVRSPKARRSQDLYATIENRLTPSNAAAYPLPIPPVTESPPGYYIPLSDARFRHSAPERRSSDLYTKNEKFQSPSNAASYPKLAMYPNREGRQGGHYVPVGEEKLYHSAPLEISQDLYAANEIPWTPSNVTTYRLPLVTELPPGYYVPLTDERAKAILESFRRRQTLGDFAVK